jgi:Flp pilus assembly pilin Flp
VEHIAMSLGPRSRPHLLRDGRGFTRLEFGLLTAMLCAMVINGIASLGGGLGNAHKPMGTPEVAKEIAVAPEAKPAVAALPMP